MSDHFAIGRRRVGGGAPSYLIAEAAQARRLTPWNPTLGLDPMEPIHRANPCGPSLNTSPGNDNRLDPMVEGGRYPMELSQEA